MNRVAGHYKTAGESKGYRLADEIAEEIAGAYGIDLADLRTRKQSRMYVQCRAEIASELRDRLNLSMPEIGMVLDRDPSAIYYLLRRYGNA